MKKVMKKSLCALLALAMVCTGLVLPGTEARAEASVSYIDDNGAPQTCEDYTVLDGSMTTLTLSAEWYVVRGNVTISERIKFVDTSSAVVNIILEDGCTLTASEGIGFTRNSQELKIYGQSGGSGKLIAKGTGGNAAIGGTYNAGNFYNASITINGGIINATTSGAGAGIGAGANANVGKITINGGTVTAIAGSGNNADISSSGDGESGGAGIGSATGAYSGQITINGGRVNATGGPGGAGIGGGYRAAVPNITINGGTVTATGGAIRPDSNDVSWTVASFGAGIGGGAGITSSSDTVTINGGTIIAIGGKHPDLDVRASGIGNYYASDKESVTMNLTIGGGIIYATSIDEKAKGSQDSWSGVVFDGSAGQVYGSPEITGNIDLTVSSEIKSTGISKYTLDVPGGSTLTVGEGGKITIPSGGTLNVGTKESPDAKLVVNGSVSNSGTVEVYGEVEGSISGTVRYHYKVEPKINFVNATYGTTPGEQVIDIANTGLDSVNITGVALTKGTDFTLNEGTGGALEKDGHNTTWTLQPKEELGVGPHTDTITVTYKVENSEKERTATAEVSLEVEKAEADVTPTNNSISYDYGDEGGITLSVDVKPKATGGIALTSAGTNQVEFVFPKGDRTEVVSDIPAEGGKASVTIEADQVKNYFNAGSENTVTVNYGGSGNLNVGSTTINVTVNKKQLEFTFTPDTKTYDGTTTVTGTLSTVTEAGVLSGDDVTATPTATVESADAGNGKTVTVTVKLSGADASYYEVGTVTGGTVTISKADITEYTAPTLNESITYTGTEQELIKTAASSLPVGASIQYYVGAKDDETAPGDGAVWKNNYTDITATEAGTYTVWYKVAGGTNYNDIPATEIGKATISKAAPIYTAPKANEGLVYTGEALGLVTAGETSDGTIKYSLEQAGEYQDDVPTGTNAQKYEVWYKVEGNENHADVGPQKIEVTIGKAASEVTVGEVAGATYGSEITLTATVSAGEITADKLSGNVQFKVDGSDFGDPVEVTGGKATLTIKDTDGDLQKKLFGENGTTSVTAVYSGNDNIDGKTSDAKSVKVEPKELTFTFEAKEKTYDGETGVTGTLSGPTGLVGTDTVESSYVATADSADVGDNVNVTVKVTISGDNAKYYKAKDPEDVTVKIVKAENNSVTAPVVATNLTYNGTDQGLIQTAGRSENGTMKYFVGASAPELDAEGWKGEITGITGKDAGKYKVWYYVDGDDNHNDTEAKSIEVKIEQKEVGLTWNNYDNLTYTGEPQNVTADFAEGAIVEGDKDNVSIVVTNGDKVEANPDSTYTATAKLNGDRADNYTLSESTKTKDYTIGKATVKFEIDGESTFTYDTEAQTVTVKENEADTTKLPGAGSYDVLYTANESGTSTDGTANKINVGAYGVWVKLSDEAYKNYMFEGGGQEAKVGTMTIEQAELKLEVSGSDITYGDTLSKSELTGTATIKDSKTTISGTWAWDAGVASTYPTVKTDSGETQYTVKFTPDPDYIGNFVDSTLSTEVTITVKPYELTPVVVAGSVESRDYDGTTDVTGDKTLEFEDMSIFDREPFNGTQPTISGTFAFTSKDAGTNTVNVTEIEFKTNGDNYSLSKTTIEGAEVIGSIQQKEVSLTWALDGEEAMTTGYTTTAHTVTATATTGVEGETVNVTVENGTQTNAGSYTATASGLTDTDTGLAANYELPDGAEREYTIEPAKVSFTIGAEDKVEWATRGETNGDPNPEGYVIDGANLTMTYDSYEHKANVTQTEGEEVKIVSADYNGYRVTYKKDGIETSNVRNAGTYEIYVTINPVSSSEDVRNYVFEGQDATTYTLKIGEITVKPYEITVAWTHLSYVYHGHAMHPNITVLNAFKADTGRGTPSSFDPSKPDECTGNVVVAFGATEGSDVGEYTVTAKLYGANAGNYTVTDPDETVNIVPAPVTFTVGDNIWVIDNGTVDRTSVALRPTWGAVTTDPDTAVHDSYPAAGTKVDDDLNTTIVYKKDGVEYTAPTEAGTYEVWVEIGNKNFRHSATSDGASHNVGELIITTDRNSVRSYTVTFDPDCEGATGGPADMTGVFANQTVVMPAIGVEREGHIFQGWSYGGRVYMPNEEFHMPSSDVTFKAQWLDMENIRSVGGTVKQEQKGDPTKSDPVLGATVTLKQGSNEIGETVTDVEGNFSFENLVPGIYNLEVRYHNGDVEVVKTYLVDVEGDSSLDGEYVLPGGALNTVVEADVTAVVDLESIVKEPSASEDEGIYTNDDAETVNEGGSVEFKMTVKGAEATPEQIEEIPVPEERIGMVLDMDLTKTVTDTSGSKTENVDDTKTPITTVIHLPPELQGKSSYTIYRFHDLGDGNDMQTITTSENENGEYLKVIREGTAIELHARLYSTYVLTWAQRSGGGGGSVGLEVELPESVVGGKVSADRPTANPGDRVTLTVTASDGFAAGEVHVYTASGVEVEVTVNDDGTYSFTMPNEAVVVTVGFGVDCKKDATCPIWPYTDAAPTQWYHDGVHYVLENGIMDGYGNNIFKPSATLSRAMVAEMLYKMNGRPAVTGDEPFDDVDEGDWYRDAVIWANANGYITGYGDGTFRPETAITREQLATIMLRYERKHSEVDEELVKRVPSLPDAETTGEWYVEGVNWAVAVWIIGGRNVGGTDLLLPASTATRAEAATMVMRWLEKVSTKA